MDARRKVGSQEHSIKLRGMREEINNEDNLNWEGNKICFPIPNNMYAF